MNRPISIKEILQNSSKRNFRILSNIKKKTIFLMKINKEIHEFLLIPFCFWLRIVNLKNNTLVIEVLNASWKTCLNFKKEKLLTILKSKYLPNLQLIKIKINPNIKDFF